MLEYLQHLLLSGSTFTAHVYLTDGTEAENRGVYAVDRIGIAFENNPDPMLLPWHAIAGITVEISDDKRAPFMRYGDGDDEEIPF